MIDEMGRKRTSCTGYMSERDTVRNSREKHLEGLTAKQDAFSHDPPPLYHTSSKFPDMDPIQLDKNLWILEKKIV